MDPTLIGAVVAEMALVPSESPVVILSPDDPAFDFDLLVEQTKELSRNWLIEVPQLGAVLQSFSKHQSVSLFMVPEFPGRLFATNVPLQSDAVVTAGGVVAVAPDTSANEQGVSKVFKTAEERYVLGVVLVPEVPDSQGDIYSHDEVRNAAFDYMENAGALGKQHREIVTGKLKILESYVAPVDFAIEGETVTKGTWLLGIRVLDDDLWSGVKSGDYTGFSIGGQAYRRPEVS